LDRDGVINKDTGYVSKIQDFEFLPNVFESLRILQSNGFKLFIVTNQSGIGRGYYSLDEFNKLNEHMLEIFKKEKIIIEKVYFCPHSPEENCICRKPNILFLKQAEKDYSINLRESWMIGDKLKDIEMGETAGCRTLLIDSKYNKEDNLKKFKDLLECSKVILNNKLFNREKIKFKSILERKSKSDIIKIAMNEDKYENFDLIDDKKIEIMAENILDAKKNNKSIIIAFGAHLIKNGLSPILRKMIEKRYVTHLATNGAGSIHDWEFSFIGKSEEDVRENIISGQFGIWEETGKYINLALISGALREKGYGESIGEMIHKEEIIIPEINNISLLNKLKNHKITENFKLIHPFKQFSIQESAFFNKIPFTIHPGFGYDIIYTHPLSDGASIGKTSEIDFLKFVESVSNLEGGVYISIGSAIMSPMIFEKALSMARNTKLQDNKTINDFLIVVNDIKASSWDFGKNLEPNKTNPEYYERFCKSFDRMGAREMFYIKSDNRNFLLSLYLTLEKLSKER